MKDRKHDNAGMTLLEVVVAVAIFSIAAIILMQGFVTSGRINRKSNLYLEATSTAQNVMEELKAKDFEETALAFNYPLDLTFSEGGFSRFHFLEDDAGKLNQEGGITVEELIKQEDGSYISARLPETGGKEGDPFSATALSEDGGKTYTFNPRKNGDNASKYYFEILNLTNQKETFDVLVTFDGSEDTPYKKKSIFAEDEKNDFETPQIAKLDTTRNGFLTMPEVWGKNAITPMLELQFVYAHDMYVNEKGDWDKTHYKKDADGNPELDQNGNRIPDPPFPEIEPKQISDDQFRNQVKRKLTVELSDNNGIITATDRYELNAFDCTDETQPGCKYATFSICPCNGTGIVNDKSEEDNKQECFCSFKSEPAAFYSSEANVDLENLYLFYYPNYESTNHMEPLDALEFVNEINYPVNLYIAKQLPTEEETKNSLAALENSYQMSLVVKEKPSMPTTDKNGNTSSNSNWFTNLSLFRAKTRLRTNLNSNISESEVAKRKSVNQVSLIYGEYRDDSTGQTVSGKAAEDILGINGLENKEQRDRIYKVSVQVYKKGAGEKQFKEKPVAQLDGSRED